MLHHGSAAPGRDGPRVLTQRPALITSAHSWLFLCKFNNVLSEVPSLLASKSARHLSLEQGRSNFTTCLRPTSQKVADPCLGCSWLFSVVLKCFYFVQGASGCLGSGRREVLGSGCRTNIDKLWNCNLFYKYCNTINKINTMFSSSEVPHQNIPSTVPVCQILESIVAFPV